MWVRTQGRERLINCQEFLLKETKQATFTIWTSNYILAEFSTRKQAIEVLDELQEYVVCHPLACYTMPNDKGVK